MSEWIAPEPFKSGKYQSGQVVRWSKALGLPRDLVRISQGYKGADDTVFYLVFPILEPGETIPAINYYADECDLTNPL